MKQLFVREEYIPAIKELLKLYTEAKTKDLIIYDRESGGASSINLQMQLGQEADGCPLCKTEPLENDCKVCPWSTASNSAELCHDYEFDSLDTRIKRLEDWLKLPIRSIDKNK